MLPLIATSHEGLYITRLFLLGCVSRCYRWSIRETTSLRLFLLTGPGRVIRLIGQSVTLETVDKWWELWLLSLSQSAFNQGAESRLAVIQLRFSVGWY